MQVTSVQISLPDGHSRGVLAYSCIVFDDCLVLNDVKLIEPRSGGRPLLQMPNRKMRYPCDHCRQNNPIDAKFCNRCGGALRNPPELPAGRSIWVDMVHPLTPTCRQMIEKAVMEEYREATERQSRTLASPG
jgi:DNA-binding cell septation regulator SpoVG